MQGFFCKKSSSGYVLFWKVLNYPNHIRLTVFTQRFQLKNTHYKVIKSIWHVPPFLTNPSLVTVWPFLPNSKQSLSLRLIVPIANMYLSLSVQSIPSICPRLTNQWPVCFLVCTYNQLSVSLPVCRLMNINPCLSNHEPVSVLACRIINQYLSLSVESWTCICPCLSNNEPVSVLVSRIINQHFSLSVESSSSIYPRLSNHEPVSLLVCQIMIQYLSLSVKSRTCFCPSL
jgi:hypothetical protein